MPENYLSEPVGRQTIAQGEAAFKNLGGKITYDYPRDAEMLAQTYNKALLKIHEVARTTGFAMARIFGK